MSGFVSTAGSLARTTTRRTRASPRRGPRDWGRELDASRLLAPVRASRETLGDPVAVVPGEDETAEQTQEDERNHDVDRRVLEAVDRVPAADVVEALQI